MIEIKLPQGAKPWHGGILPAAKLTQEISNIRHVPMCQDVVSPASHSEFSMPIELLHFCVNYASYPAVSQWGLYYVWVVATNF